MTGVLDRRLLVSRSLRAIKWSGLSEFIARGVTPVTLLLLTRLVAPSQFGLFVGASLVVTFCQVFVESGMTRALVQSNADIRNAVSTVFWAVLGIAITLWAIVYLSADVISRAILGDSQSGSLVRALALQLPIAALSASHRALLERELNFRVLFVSRLCSAVMMSATAILLAMSGHGAWSLVAGVLLGATAEALVVWRLSPFRPRFRFRLGEVKSVAWFSGWALGQDLLAWLVVYADSLIVALLLDVERLGTYRLGTMLVAGLFAAAFVPIEKVLFSAFSRVGARQHVGSSVWQLTFFGAVVALPVGLVLLMTRQEIEAYVFPDAWVGMGLVIGLMGLREAIANVAFAVDPAYKGVGRPDIAFKVRAFNLMMLISVQLAALPLGFGAFLLARTVATIVALVLILHVVGKFFGSWRQYVHIKEYRSWMIALGAVVIVCGVGAAPTGVFPWRVVLAVLVSMGFAAFVFTVARAKLRLHLASS